MNADTALATMADIELQEHAELINVLYQRAFSIDGTLSQRAEGLANMVMSAAASQIDEETSSLSPWYIPEGQIDDKKTMIRERAITERALLITANWKEANEVAQALVINHMRKRKLELFPPTGTFQTLEVIVRGQLPESEAGAALATVAFFAEVEERGIDDPDLPVKAAGVVKKRGVYALGHIRAALNNAEREAKNGDQEFDAETTLDELLNDADRMSNRVFQETHKGRKGIPPMPATITESANGGAMIMLRAYTHRQKTVVLTRLGTMMDKTHQSLLEPITADRLLNLVVLAAREKADAIIPELRGLIKSVVLGDPVTYDVYQLLETNKDEWFDLGAVQAILTHHGPTYLDLALNRLGQYGVVREITKDNVTLWCVETETDDRAK